MSESWTRIPLPEWIDTEQQLAAACEYLYNSCMREGNPLGFDTETTGLNIISDTPILLSLSDGLRRFACYAEWARHPWIQQALFLNPQIIKTGTHLKFDKHMLANIGVEMIGPFEDTLVMDWVVNENRAHGLKETALDHLGIQMLSFKEVFGLKPKETPGDAIRRTMADPEGRRKAIEYSGLDAFASVGVRNFLKARMQEIYPRDGYTMWQYFQEWEVPYTPILWNMERRGFTICTGHLRDQKGPMEREMETIEAQLAQMAGWVVNPNSPKQLQKLFFEQLQMKPLKYTKGGATGVKQPSTDDEVLSEWVLINDPVAGPYAKMIQKFRGVAKIYGTYVEGLLEAPDTESRIHTTLWQQGTVTGRISSAAPNLMNIPRPGTDIYGIRSAFIASMGKRLVIADYDQLEMKLMAHWSEDPKMIEAILSGKDLHCYTVSLMNNEDYDEVVGAKKAKKSELTSRQMWLLEKRQEAKATGFGLIYGIGEVKLGADLGLPIIIVPNRRGGTRKSCPEAKKLIDKYLHDVFPGVDHFMKSTKQQCRETEYVQTLLGRFRHLPGINAPGGEESNGVAAEAGRQSVNTIIQGTAADVTKGAMIRAEHDPILNSLGAKMLLQIHDELIFECDDNPEIVRETKKRVKEIMEDPFPGFSFRVPLTVGAGDGMTWVEAK